MVERATDKVPAGEKLDIQVIRSKRRTRSVSARLLNWYTLEIRAPAHLSEQELRPIIERLARQILDQRAKQREFTSSELLEERAQYWNRRLFEGQLRWRSIRFVGNQNSRYGSCTPNRGTIRISDRLIDVPQFVRDYVIVHELAHLLEPNHTQAFWDLVYCCPLVERARGYLMAMAFEEDDPSTGEKTED